MKLPKNKKSVSSLLFTSVLFPLVSQAQTNIHLFHSPILPKKAEHFFVNPADGADGAAGIPEGTGNGGSGGTGGGSNGGQGGNPGDGNGSSGASGGGQGAQGGPATAGGVGVNGGGSGGDGSGVNAGGGAGGSANKGGGGGGGGISGGGGGGGGGGNGVVLVAGQLLTGYTGGNGGNGGAGSNLGGGRGGDGGGGGGGHGALISGAGTYTSQTGVMILGGNGGNGGGIAEAGGGGGGGAGGDGILANSSIALNQGGTVIGGSGGNGGIRAAGGGSAGNGLTMNAFSLINNTGTVIGGNGGNGGATITSTGGSAGAGGLGINIVSGSIVNTGAVFGGMGGNGGQGFILGGLAGNGAQAINGNNLSILNHGWFLGGFGGQGGLATSFGGVGGAGGNGANAVEGANITLVNSGRITFGSGGAGGLGASSGAAGTSGAAVFFTGGVNRLELWAGSLIEGSVLAVSGGTDSLALGGESNSSFDLSTVGTQYLNFANFQKVGSSVWTVFGTTAVPIPVAVIEGTLNLAGVVTGDLSVLANGRLIGTGTVAGVAEVNGIIAPGNSIGTINAGTYISNPGSIYQVEINALGQSDLINVSGATILNGGLVQVLPEAGNYVTPIRYTIVTSAGGVSGRYDGLLQNMAFLTFMLDYDPNHVYLVVSQRPFTFAADTPNQVSTAFAVEVLGAANPVFDAVLMLNNAEQAKAAFDRLSGEIHATALSVLLDDSRYLREAIFNRMQEAFTPPVFNSKLRKSSDLWVDGFGAWGNMETNHNAAKTNRSSRGIFVGYDRQISEFLRLGVLGGYGRSEFNIPNRNSYGNSDNYSLAVYGGSRINHWLLSGGAAYTWHDLETHRNAVFPGFNNFLSSDYDAHTTQVFAEMGYGMDWNRFFLEPFLGLAYASINNDGWQESGGPASLRSHSGELNVFYSTLGLRETAEVLKGERFNLNERAMFGWRHAYNPITPWSGFAFVSNNNPFIIGGVPMATDSLVADVGIDLLNLAETLTLHLGYIGQFATNVEDNGVAGTLSIRFS